MGSLAEAVSMDVSAEVMIFRTNAMNHVLAGLAEAFEAMNTNPRFYFHFCADGHISPDHCGLELPDLAAAREWAETEARHLAEPEMPLGLDPSGGVITITDEFGEPLAEVIVRDVMAGSAGLDR